MTRLALVVCTANVCRSLVGERAMRRRIDGVADAEGELWTVASAGTARVGAEVDRATIAAAGAEGLDISGHVRQSVERVIGNSRPELVLTMAREHLRAVTAVEPALWPRTFTLKELARRARDNPYSPQLSFAQWLSALHDGRRAAAMMNPNSADDVEDPYGGPRAGYEAMVAEVVTAVEDIVEFGPWLRPVGSHVTPLVRVLASRHPSTRGRPRATRANVRP